MRQALPILFFVLASATWHESPERLAMRPLVEKLGSMAEEIVDVVVNELGDWVLGDDFFDLKETPDAELYASCLQCRTLVNVLTDTIRAGVPWEICRNVSIGVCHRLLNETGWNSDIVCPGVIDAYGIHVYYIISVTNDTAEEICQLWNMCPYRSRDSAINHPDVLRPHQPSFSVKSDNSVNKANRLDSALKILHLSDIHVDKEYLEGSETQCDLPLCCRDGEGSAGTWGDYLCNIPPRTVELFMSFVANFSADIVVYAGDSPPSAVWEETQWGQLNVSRYVADMIGKYLPGTPAFTAIGNHETYPTNLYYVGRPEIQEFNREFAKYWQPLSNFSSAQMATMEYAGYFEILVRPGLRVISFNSNYGYSDNFYNLLNIDSQDFADMKQFMEDAFNLARQNGEKVLLISHHPTGGDNYHLYFTDFLQDVLKRNGDLVVLYLLGHTHADNYRMLTDLNSGDVYAVQVAAPCVTSSPYINPSARLYYLDPVTFEVIDYDQYALDLASAMKYGTTPEIKFAYRFTEEYNVTDGSPTSYKELTDRFETDDALFELYRYNRETRSYVPEPCTGQCKVAELCELRTIGYDAYQSCSPRS